MTQKSVAIMGALTGTSISFENVVGTPLSGTGVAMTGTVKTGTYMLSVDKLGASAAFHVTVRNEDNGNTKNSYAFSNDVNTVLIYDDASNYVTIYFGTLTEGASAKIKVVNQKQAQVDNTGKLITTT